ncbi:MAG: hypothetical protein NVSMB23_08730 [Myxococcales bacterium]
MPPSPNRVRAFDWLRGVAVLVMIQTHALVLLRPELRAGSFFTTLQWIDGLVAPSFILAAGFSMALTQVRAAASSNEPDARRRRLRRTLRRIGEVLFVATLTNWMWFPIFREPRWILRVDILQCIGVSLLIALPILSSLAPRPRVLQLAALLLAAAAFGAAPLAEHVRGPLAGFLNTGAGGVFPLLPWGGYVYLGAAIGAAAATGGPRAAAAWLVALAGLGALLWALTPQIAAAYPPHEFWVTDPANHARRWTQVCLVALLLLGVERLARGASPWPVRFVELFGTSSLAGYFLHEMLLFYRFAGVSFEAVWGSRCTWARYWPVLALLIAGTFALTLLVDRVYRRVDRRFA